MTEILLTAAFCLSAFVVFWAYAGYPLCLLILSIFFARKVQTKDWNPDISLIITCHNEERRIASKLDNSLALSYPKEKLEIIVVSDGSNDATEAIVRTYADRGVRLLAIPERHGKHHGQGSGIGLASHDIVALSDATTFLKDDALMKIVRSFSDPSIGCVSGTDVVVRKDGTTSGEGVYVKYEMLLRELESRVGSLVGASGCFYAVRKSLCSQWIDEMSSDFYLPIVARMNGMRTILDQEALAYYTVLNESSREFERKVRTVVHGLEVLFRFKTIMNPFRYDGYALQILSHKLFRWLVPFALCAGFLSNLFLLPHGRLYEIALALQGGLYTLALLGWTVKKLQHFTLIRIPLFFVMVNCSIIIAWYKYLLGVKYVVWDATKR